LACYLPILTSIFSAYGFVLVGQSNNSYQAPGGNRRLNCSTWRFLSAGQSYK